MSKWEICDRCSGAGHWTELADPEVSFDPEDGMVEIRCHDCNGSGKVRALSAQEREDARADQMECAMEAGMMYGVNGYNEVMGY